MSVQKGYKRVGKLFLKNVYEKIKKLRSKMDTISLKPEEESLLRKFDGMFYTKKKPNVFYKSFYRSGLMIAKHQVVEKRKVYYVEIFNFLRIFFIGILSGDPRTGYLRRRVSKYEATYDIVDTFESFIVLYRKKFKFKKHKLSHKILASANVFSKCEKKPYELCLPPKCEYIRRTRRARGYCRTKTRKAKSS